MLGIEIYRGRAGDVGQCAEHLSSVHETMETCHSGREPAIPAPGRKEEDQKLRLSWLHSESKASLSYRRPCLGKTNET